MLQRTGPVKQAGPIILGGVLGGILAGLISRRPAYAATDGEKLDHLIDLNTLMAQQMGRLVEVAEQLAGKLPLSSVVSVPLDPAVMARAIMAIHPEGKAFYDTFRGTWVAPAGVVTEAIFALPPELVCVTTGETITSDFYDPNIVLEVFIDEKALSPWGITLTGPIDISYGLFYVKLVSVRVVVTNNSAVNAMISQLAYGTMLEKSYYQQFYAPVMQYVNSVLEAVAREGLALR